MLVVLAHTYDQEAQQLVSRWSTNGAGLLTCSDLSISGWRHYSDAPAKSMAVVSGNVVPVAEITGVVTLLPCVFEQELMNIVPSDRAYVAAEMTAFLLSWLSSLRCPVMNRPTPTCLSGTYWQQDRWISAAAGLGIPIHPVRRRAALTDVTGIAQQSELRSVAVTVVGEQCFGEADETLASWTRQLAELAGVTMLTVHFSGPERGAYFMRADLRPDLATTGVEEAILTHLEAQVSLSEATS